MRKRDGSVLAFDYDALGRVIRKTVPERSGLDPAHTRDVFYAYDLRGLQTKARFGDPDGEGVSAWYDGFGRPVTTLLAMGGHYRYVTYYYDADGRVLSLTHPDGAVVGSLYDGLGRLTHRYEYSATPGIDDHVVRYFYYPDGSRGAIVRGAGSGGFTTVVYRDAVGRPSIIANDLPVPGSDVVFELAYNPASQIVRRSVSNDAYAAPTPANMARGYQANGLNQYTGTTSDGAPNWSFEYNANGNLTRSAHPAGTLTTAYLYDVENRLVAASGAKNATLVYDPLGRLFQVTSGSGAKTQFLYDGDRMIAEYDGSGAMLKRYVHGPGTDEPVAAYDGPARGLANRRYMLPDERGSIAALVNADGSPSTINRYDAWGIPGAGNGGRFQYTGQAWIAELGLYYYKARFLSPWIGRFMQVDPVGYEGGTNLYAYVGNDPLNFRDATGAWRDPIIVRGGTKPDRLFVREELRRVLSTERGQEMEQKSKDTFLQETIRLNNEGRIESIIETGEIFIDPNRLPTVMTDDGPKRASTARILGHELGHTVMKDRDDGPNKMNNINKNENPIVVELGESPRTRYEYGDLPPPLPQPIPNQKKDW